MIPTMQLTRKNVCLAILVSVLLALYFSTTFVIISRFLLFPKEGYFITQRDTGGNENGHVIVSQKPNRPPPSTPTNNNLSLIPSDLPIITANEHQLDLSSSSSPTSPLTLLEKYFIRESTIPVVVLCHNRAEELGETLDSLLSVRHARPSHILVSQDGIHDAVSYQATSRKLKLAMDVNNPARPGTNDGGKRIARHYGFSLERAFQDFPDAPAVVVIEDDMRFSPDFLEYFVFIGAMLDRDPTLWCVSAWNDNGFAGLVKDPFTLRRTVLFPGLGWLLTRTAWLDMREQWPMDQWDWFVRARFQKRDLECIYPEVPRIFHAGRKGTFMDPDTHAKYFDRISHNTDAGLNWFKDAKARVARDGLMLSTYNTNLGNAISRGVHVESAEMFDNLVFRTAQDNGGKTDADTKAVVLWYEADPDPRFEYRIHGFAQFFGIWHQLLRGSHESVLEFYYRDVKILAINMYRPRITTSSWFTPYSHQSMFVSLKPAGIVPFEPMEFVRRVKTQSAPPT